MLHGATKYVLRILFVLMLASQDAINARATVLYDDSLRDARNDALMPSTRVHAAFDAIYACCQPAGTLDESLESLALSIGDAKLVISLRDWVQNTAPMGPLPMPPSEAVALAERVHKNLGAI